MNMNIKQITYDLRTTFVSLGYDMLERIVYAIHADQICWNTSHLEYSLITRRLDATCTLCNLRATEALSEIRFPDEP